MKKRSLLLCLALVLSLTMAIGGTLAYLTDTEYSTNVMVVGNVKIELIEQERIDQKVADLTDNVQTYKQDKPLYPAVVSDTFTAAEADMWSSTDVVGVVDKIVTVKNVGSSEAYFRTVVAFQKLADMSKLIINWNDGYTVKQVVGSNGAPLEVTMTNGITYVMYEAIYNGKLAAGETSAPSLLQLYLDPTATNETIAGLGTEYSILVAAQAMQTNNFDAVVAAQGIGAALDTAFKPVAEKHPWGDYTFEGEPEPVWVNTVEEFKTALANAEKGATIGLMPGTYSFNNETINVDKSVTILGFGKQPSILENVVFDVDSISASAAGNTTRAANNEMSATFENLYFEGTSRIIVGNRSHHNGLGGPDALPTTKLTVKNCTAETTFAADRLTGGKGQFIYLAATYEVKLDLTLEGNNFVNAHSIAGEDASPVVNGNGTVIQNVTITGNTFGSAANPCDRYAVKFGRRANGATINISNNTVYGATTADKDFYILDLWQSGANKQDNLVVNLTGNTIKCTPDAGRAVYAAYIESSVKGANLSVSASGNTTDEVLNKAVDSQVTIPDATVENLNEAFEQGKETVVVTGGTVEDSITVPANKELVVNGGTFEDKVTIGESAKATIDSGNFENTVTVGKGAEIVVNNADMVVADYRVVIDVDEGSATTLNGGTFTSYEYTQIIDAQSPNAVINITGGTYNSGEWAYGIWVGYNSVVNISGGTFNAWSLFVSDNPKSCDLNVSGGIFNLEVIDAYQSHDFAGVIEITGGTFSIDPSAYLAEGYTATQNADGMWVVSK